MNYKKALKVVINGIVKFFKNYFSLTIYILLSLLWIGFVIWMIIENKMSEIDSSMKYM